jgi:hypothetical protein
LWSQKNADSVSQPGGHNPQDNDQQLDPNGGVHDVPPCTEQLDVRRVIHDATGNLVELSPFGQGVLSKKKESAFSREKRRFWQA